MMQPAIDVLTAPRLPQLWRAICEYAGVPTRRLLAPNDCFVIRCGAESPELLARLLQEALPEDGAEITTHAIPDDPDYKGLPQGQVLVRPGYEFPCPDGFRQSLQQVAELGSLLIFAVEQRDCAGGCLRQLTWVGLPDELQLPEIPLAAAVARQYFGPDANG